MKINPAALFFLNKHFFLKQIPKSDKNKVSFLVTLAEWSFRFSDATHMLTKPQLPPALKKKKKGEHVISFERTPLASCWHAGQPTQTCHSKTTEWWNEACSAVFTVRWRGHELWVTFWGRSGPKSHMRCKFCCFDVGIYKTWEWGGDVCGPLNHIKLMSPGLQCPPWFNCFNVPVQRGDVLWAHLDSWLKNTSFRTDVGNMWPAGQKWPFDDLYPTLNVLNWKENC